MADSCGLVTPDPKPQPAELEPLGRGGWLAMDLRSLALMRVLIGVIVLVDLALRARNLGMHYTDSGTLPRAELTAEFGLATKYYAYAWFGTAGPQIALMAVHAVVALLFLIGYRTRITTILMWFLVASLQYRNPLVCHGGDHMLRLTLFWTIFLPLGARWSIDSALNSGPRRRNDAYFDIAVVGFLVQLAAVYVVAGIEKLLSQVWVSGDGVYYALHIDQHVTGVGIWMRQFEFVLPLLTWLTILLELFGPLLLFLPRFTNGARLLAVAGFIGLHVMFGTCFYLTVFPIMAIVIWLGVTPGFVWDRLFARLRTPARLGLRLYYDGDCGFCQRTVWILRAFLLLPETRVDKVQSDPAIEAVFRANNSWVVVDHAGEPHLRFDGILAVLRTSPLAWPFAPLFALPPSRAIGNMLYDLVARNRGAASKLTFFLRPRPMTIEPSMFRNGVALCFIGLVCAINFRMLNDVTKKLVPRQIESVGRLLHLDQQWVMFARGMEADGWYILRAVKADGTEFDLISGASPISWAKPDGISSMYPSHRWAVSVFVSRDPKYPARGANFVRYAFEEWNRTHDEVDHLVEVELVFMLEMTEPGFIHPPVREPVASWPPERIRASGNGLD